MRIEDARERAKAESRLNAFISLTLEEGPRSVAVKDVIDVRGVPTTAGASVLPCQPANRDAPVISAIRAAGYGVVGKTNLHQWALGVTSDNPTYGRVRNPVDLDRSPGGSSGGSAAAAAAKLCDWAMGTDTGGSIRVPASFCGIFGLKPTTGIISMDGVVPVSPTMDTVGPLATDVKTLTAAFRAMSAAGSDAASMPHLGRMPQLCLPKGWVTELDNPTRMVWERLAVGRLLIHLPDIDELARVHQVIVRTEASRYHRRRLAEHPECYAPDVFAFLLSGLSLSSSDYDAALRSRTDLANAVEDAMGDNDAILLPTTPRVAPISGTHESAAMDSLNRYTRPFNVTGHPAISIPLGGTPPVGMQLVGHLACDASLISFAARFAAEINKPQRSLSC